MFGISLWELLLIGLVALVFVGPDKLPVLLGTLGRWSNKLRRMTTEVRQQTGIDDLLRQNGIRGGLDEIRELRNIVRGNVAGLTGGALGRPSSLPASPVLNTAGAPSAPAPAPRTLTDIYADIPGDRSREYPEEGCDSYGCLADDLWTDSNKQAFEDEHRALSELGAEGHPNEHAAVRLAAASDVAAGSGEDPSDDSSEAKTSALGLDHKASAPLPERDEAAVEAAAVDAAPSHTSDGSGTQNVMASGSNTENEPAPADEAAAIDSDPTSAAKGNDDQQPR